MMGSLTGMNRGSDAEIDLTERKAIATKGLRQKKDRFSKWSTSEGEEQTDDTEKSSLS